jgi:5-(carboxyamino)imidazole ribonucleotide synthase
VSRYDIGFLGGGQLARMSIQAAQRMGLRCVSLDKSDSTPAAQIADHRTGSLASAEDIAGIIQESKRTTLENEFVPAEVLRQAIQLTGKDETAVLPGPEPLATIQDKLKQRLALQRAGVPSPQAVEFRPDAPEAATEALGLPIVLKARFGGYDGKGTFYARSREEYQALVRQYEQGDRGPRSEMDLGWLAESFVPFRRELAVMVYRSESETGCFPTMETVQVDQVCNLVFPSGVDASEIAVAAVEAVKGYGLFGVELFELPDGSFQVNEIAPRPHNTGHYTLDWGGISQFEQHVRLVAELPCPPAEGGPCCMANLLGQPEANDWRTGLRRALEAVPGAHVHWYGKSPAKTGRKMGHVNVAGENAKALAEEARKRFYAGWTEPDPH